MATKFVVAGTGWVAGEYFKSIALHPNAELYGVFTRSKEHAQARLKEFGLEAKIFTDFSKMANDPEVDAVVLCSTPDVRPDQAILAAEHGKHLVIEKPVTLNKESLWKVGEAIEKNRVHTVVSFVLRWNPLFNIIKALIHDNALGNIFMAQLDYWHNIGPHYPQYSWSSQKALGGSSMLSAGCHAVDALRYFAGEAEEVMAYSCPTSADSEYGFDPNVIAVLKLKNGGIGKVSSSLECKSTYKYNVHLLGDKGSIMNNKMFTHKLPGQTDYAEIPTILPDSGDVTHHPFQEEINDFLTSLQLKVPSRCDFFDAFKTMEVCFAIDESAATGQKVKLPLA